MTASEWAERIELMDECSQNFTVLSRHRRELADHLLRVPTDDEREAMAEIARGVKCLTAYQTLAKYLERTAPAPPVEWHDVGEGFIATLNGWTLTVSPYAGVDDDRIAWRVARRGHNGEFGRSDTLDAAKSAAVEAARKLGAK